MDLWTATSGPVSHKMVARDFRCLRVQPLKYIDRKVMMYPMPSANRVQYYLTIDPDGPLDLDKCSIPYFPEEHEIVSVKDTTFVYVDRIDESRKTLEGFPLRKIGGRNTRWTLQPEKQEYSLLNVTKPVEFKRSLNYFHLYDNV